MALSAAVSALALAASGCVTIHGELEVVPAATKGEAARVLAEFTKAYNAGDKAYDPELSAGRVTGALGQINQASLRAKGKNTPGGNPRHAPLELTDARFLIPAKAGWPRWFLADTDSNRDVDDDPQQDTRWFVAFVKSGPDAQWKAAYLSILTPDEIPEFSEDAQGNAVPVANGAKDLAVAPGRLSEEYAGFLGEGGELFADGQHTSSWRAQREENADRPGRTTQWVDQPLDKGDFAPLALRTEDGGAMVLFATRHFEKQTAARGVPLSVRPEVGALLKGDIKRAVTLERVSNQVVTVPRPEGSGSGGKVVFLNRIEGLTGAVGE
ncbi:hypothetical protein ABZ874_11905 [Streptomyces albidoflavus]|uniref:hypothetical protein n=1 Tax=Streptomyces albidoflavus TaxID=1886 RepID=UPI0033EE3B62